MGVRHQVAANRPAVGDGAIHVPDPLLLGEPANVRQMQQRLDVPHREAFLLKLGEGLDYQEMARITGASVPALKMRVKRARDQVRARWKELDGDR